MPRGVKLPASAPAPSVALQGSPVRSPAVFRQQRGEGIARPQTAEPALERRVDCPPRIAARALNLAGREPGPASVARVVGICPRQNLFDAQTRALPTALHTAAAVQNTGQRVTARQAAHAHAQRGLQRRPGLLAAGGDPTGAVCSRPVPGTAVVCIGPDKDLLHGQARSWLRWGRSTQWPAAVTVEQKGQRVTAATPAEPAAQRLGDRRPRVPRGLLHWSAMGVGPAPGPLLVRVGPSQDGVNVQARLPGLRRAFGGRAARGPLSAYTRQRANPGSTGHGADCKT